jgi:regulator of sirC expression with transglutaminase-like and TPR domain
MRNQVKEAFRRELAKDQAEINLAYAALLFAEYLTGPIDVSLYLSRLDAMAEALQPALLSAETDQDRVEAINQYLFGELHFTGNTNNYYHADNSFLHKVLDLCTGIPISLSLVYLEIGWRLGLPLWGIGLPGHFIVGYGPPDDPLYLDVFNGGLLLSEADCLALARVPMSNRQSFREYFLKPASKKAILYRMLLNLKQIYLKAEQWEEAYRLVDLMLIVGHQTTDIRDRGLIAYRLERRQAAIFDLQRYLFLLPHARDAAWLKKRVETMEEELLRLN